MIRLFLYLLGKKDYEECKSCDTLKQQLAIKNEEVRMLNETLMSILKPKVYENPAIEIQGQQKIIGTFAQRRAALEARDRETARVQSESKLLGRSDNDLRESMVASNTVEKLEKQLGIEEN